MTNNTKNMTAWIAIAITVIGGAITAVIWASDAHSEIKKWTTDQDTIIQSQIKSDTYDKYVRQTDYKEDVSRLDERQKFIKEDLIEVKDLIKEIHQMLARQKKCNQNNN